MWLTTKVCAVLLIYVLGTANLVLAQEKSSTSGRASEEETSAGFNCPSGETSETPPAVTFRLGDITRKARELPQPRYPQEAKAVGMTRIVRARVVVDLLSGKPVWARIATADPILEKAVKEVVCQARFIPANDISPLKASGLISYKVGKSKAIPLSRKNRPGRKI